MPLIKSQILGHENMPWNGMGLSFHYGLTYVNIRPSYTLEQPVASLINVYGRLRSALEMISG